MTGFDAYISSNGRFIVPSLNINYLVDLSQSEIPSMAEATESSVRIAGRDGDIVLSTTYEPKPFNIVCYTEDNLTPQEKKIEENKVKTFLNSIKNTTKTFALESDEAFYDIKYSGVLSSINYPMHMQFSIPFKSSSPYGKDLNKKSIVGNDSSLSNTVTEVGAIFTIEGPAQTPKILFNNHEMFYNNVLESGARLEINSRNSTITHVNSLGTKTNAMRYYNHEFPKIINGNNTLEILSGISDNTKVKVEWYDLKL